jgi:hypothetical protein
VVLEVNPADGARDVIVRREVPVLIRFNKKMNPASLAAALSLPPAVAYRIETGRDAPDTDYDLLRVVLLSGAGASPPARYRTRYTLTLDTAARDFEGLNLQEPFRASFTTGAAAVIGTRPENGGTLTNLAPTNPVVILFNAPLDHSTVGDRSLRIRPRLPMSPNLRITEDAQTGWSRVEIQATWQADTSYDITLQGVRTAANEPLANTPYTLRFKTAKLRMLLPPAGQAGSRR